MIAYPGTAILPHINKVYISNSFKGSNSSKLELLIFILITKTQSLLRRTNYLCTLLVYKTKGSLIIILPWFTLNQKHNI